MSELDKKKETEEMSFNYRFFLPEFGYFLKLIKRNIVIAFVVFPVFMLGALMLYQRHQERFKYTAKVIFNPKDTHLDPGGREEDERRFLQLSNLFKFYITDVDFLADNAEKIGISYDAVNENDPKKISIQKIKAILKSEKEKTKESEVRKFRSAIATEISRNLQNEFNEREFSFLISYISPSSEESYQMATFLMNDFCEIVLRGELDGVKKSLQTLIEFSNVQLKNINESSKKSWSELTEESSTRNKTQISVLSPEQKNKYKQEEARILDEIDKTKKRIDETKNKEDKQLSDLRNELARLKTIYRGSHPSVKVVQSEIDRMLSLPDISKENKKLTAMRVQLSALHQLMKRSGIKTDSEIIAPQYTDAREFFVDRVSEKIMLLQLEREYLERQLNDPSTRTKFSYVNASKLSNAPVNGLKKKLTFFLSAVGAILAICAIAVMREFLGKKIRGRWIALNMIDKDIYCHLKRKYGCEKKLGPSDVDKLEENKYKSTSLEQRSFVELKRVLSQLKRTQLTDITLFISCGVDSASKNLLPNLATLLSESYQEKVILVDFNSQTSIHSGIKAKSTINQYFRAEVGLNEIIVRSECNKFRDKYRYSDSDCGDLSLQSLSDTRHVVPLPPKGSGGMRIRSVESKDEKYSAEIAYDVISPNIGEEGRIKIDRNLLEKMFVDLCRLYDTVLVNGFGARDFIDNSLLLQNFKSAIITVDLLRGRKDELRTILQNIDKEKLRGSIILD